MKKILYTFLVAALILVSAPEVLATSDIYYTNNEGLSMTEEQYNNLLNQAFSEKQVESMDLQTFTDNKDIQAQIVAQVKKYVKTTTSVRNGIEFHTSEFLTEDEIMQEVEATKNNPPYPSRDATGTYYNGIAYTSYKVVQTYIVNLDDDTMRYKVDIHWLQIPTTRSYDIMGIGIESNKVQINSGLNFRETWWASNSEHYATSCYPKYENTGGTVMFLLPSGSLQSLEAYLYFTVDKKAGVNTVTTLSAAGDYAHATTSVSDDAYNYFSTNIVTGIEIDNPYANSYDEMSEAVASFVGTW